MPITIHNGTITINNPMQIGGFPGAPAGGGTYATGGTITDISGYRIHAFNSSGTFTTTSSWPSGRTIEYLVVAGGGSNDIFGQNGGGPGAGGLLTASGTVLAASTNYVATIGAAGGAMSNGANSSLIGGVVSVTALGGGGSTLNGPGQNGGSGAGGIGSAAGNQFGGSGTAGQGNAGASGTGKQDSTESGGGGGAGYAGGITTGPNFSNYQGGFGLISTIFPTVTSSTTATTPGNNLYLSYTFTIDSGLWFTAGQPISVTNPGNANLSMCGIVTSYSGTNLVCLLRLASNVGYSTSASSWNINCAYAGGGAGSVASGISLAGLGGGGGQYGNSYPTEWRGGAPNSGGGGFYGNELAIYQGGSGVVLIKYAYP